MSKKPSYLLRSNLAALAPFYKKPRDVRNQKCVKHIYLHITGRATWNNAVKWKQHPLARVEDYFNDAGRPFAHYCIDPWGRIIQIAEELERPWAQGWGAYGGYRGLEKKLNSGELKVPEWWGQSLSWDRDVVDMQTPLDLVDPGKTPNDESVAIEMIQYGNQFKLTTSQYLAAAVLCLDISFRHCLSINPINVLGHEDADPWGRGNRYGGWDPGAGRVNGKPRWCWSTFWGMFDMELVDRHCGQHKPHKVEGRQWCEAVIATPKKSAWIKKIEDRVFK